MKFPGILEAGLKSGVLTEAKWVKGTYIAVSTPQEMQKIPCGVITSGTKVYVASENCEYVWNKGAWKATAGGLSLPADQDKLYGLQNGKWVEITIDEPIRQQLNELNTQVQDLSTQSSQLEEQLSTVQDSLVKLDEEVVKYTPVTVTIVDNDNREVRRGIQSIDWGEPTTPSLGQVSITTEPSPPVKSGRKTIQLRNEDSISGVGAGELGDRSFNLIMVSKTNTVELGSSGIHLNINTADNITVNNDQVILTTQDKDELEQKIANISVTLDGNYYTKAETDDKIDQKVEESTADFVTRETLTQELNPIKVDIQDLNDKISDRYTKAETNNQISIAIQGIDDKFEDYVTEETYNRDLSAINNAIDAKQNLLVSGTNIRTINGDSILGNGDLRVEAAIRVATTTGVGGIVSGVYESDSEGGSKLAVVVDRAGYASVRLPPIIESADQQDIVEVLNSGPTKTVIDGGTADW